MYLTLTYPHTLFHGCSPILTFLHIAAPILLFAPETLFGNEVNQQFVIRKFRVVLTDTLSAHGYGSQSRRG